MQDLVCTSAGGRSDHSFLPAAPTETIAPYERRGYLQDGNAIMVITHIQATSTILARVRVAGGALDDDSPPRK